MGEASVYETDSLKGFVDEEGDRDRDVVRIAEIFKGRNSISSPLLRLCSFQFSIFDLRLTRHDASKSRS